MTSAIGALLIVVGIQAAAIVALLVQRTRRMKVERDLRKREERVRLVADRAPVMIWTARPDTTLDYLNRTCVEFTGLPLEKLQDEGWLDAVHPEDRAYIGRGGRRWPRPGSRRRSEERRWRTSSVVIRQTRRPHRHSDAGTQRQAGTKRVVGHEPSPPTGLSGAIPWATAFVHARLHRGATTRRLH